MFFQITWLLIKKGKKRVLAGSPAHRTKFYIRHILYFLLIYAQAKIEFLIIFRTITLKNKNMGILYALLIGALAGWLAGKIMKGGGFGAFINIILGIAGGAVGNWLFGTLGIHVGSGIVSDLITGVIGAIVVLFIASLFKK